MDGPLICLPSQQNKSREGQPQVVSQPASQPVCLEGRQMRFGRLESDWVAFSALRQVVEYSTVVVDAQKRKKNATRYRKRVHTIRMPYHRRPSSSTITGVCCVCVSRCAGKKDLTHQPSISNIDCIYLSLSLSFILLLSLSMASSGEEDL